MPVHSDRLHSPTFNTWPPFPPANESELDRALRFEEEQEAKQISDAIDVALELEKQEKRKRRESEAMDVDEKVSRAVIRRSVCSGADSTPLSEARDGGRA